MTAACIMESNSTDEISYKTKKLIIKKFCAPVTLDKPVGKVKNRARQSVRYCALLCAHN